MVGLTRAAELGSFGEIFPGGARPELEHPRRAYFDDLDADGLRQWAWGSEPNQNAFGAETGFQRGNHGTSPGHSAADRHVPRSRPGDQPFHGSRPHRGIGNSQKQKRPLKEGDLLLPGLKKRDPDVRPDDREGNSREPPAGADVENARAPGERRHQRRGQGLDQVPAKESRPIPARHQSHPVGRFPEQGPVLEEALPRRFR